MTWINCAIMLAAEAPAAVLSQAVSEVAIEVPEQPEPPSSEEP